MMIFFFLHMRSQARALKIQAACLIWKSDACEEACLRWFGWSHGAFDAESDRSNQIATMGRPLIFSCIPLESHQIPISQTTTSPVHNLPNVALTVETIVDYILQAFYYRINVPIILGWGGGGG